MGPESSRRVSLLHLGVRGRLLAPTHAVRSTRLPPARLPWAAAQQHLEKPAAHKQRLPIRKAFCLSSLPFWRHLRTFVWEEASPCHSPISSRSSRDLMLNLQLT